MNLTELRNKSAHDLHKELTALLHEQFNLRMQRGLGKLPKPHLFKNVRRAIAQVNTILREKAEQ